MTINTLYVPLFNIEEVILDKDSGLPLTAGVVKFYRDSQRLTSKPVYQIAGVSPNYSFISVGAELTLGIAGDFVDQDGDPFVPYAYPYDAAGELDLYYVTVESEGGIAQFVRQAVPYVPDGGINPADRASTQNELSNPQFVEVNFPSTGTTTISVTGSNTVTPVAPGWDLITSGTGTVDLERLEPTSAGVPTNPPYTLRIQASAGLGATVTLRQRLTNTPSIFRGGFVSGSITAAVISGGGSFITMTYAPSTGSSTEIIPSTSITTDGAYHTIENNAEIPDQVNTAASTGYVDINITIPTSRNIAITSIQIVGTATGVDIPFDQQTAARQKDHLFHYYEDSLVRQPKNSLLTGWNFGLNPWQSGTKVVTNNLNNGYINADQTIIVQQNYVASATSFNTATGQADVSNNYGLQVQAATDHNQFALIQYLDANTARPYWGKILSSLVTATLHTTHSTNCHIKMRLIYKAGLPTSHGNGASQNYPIASWAEGQDPVFDADFTVILPVNDPVYLLDTSLQGYAFEKFQLPASTDVNMTLGICVYTIDNMDSTGTADFIVFDDISLVQNDFAIATQPQTFDEVFRQCQYFYEKSYNVGVIPGTATNNGLRYASVPFATDGSSTVMYKNSFQLIYQQLKRVPPVLAFYAPDGTNGSVQLAARSGDGTTPAPSVGTNPVNVASSLWTAFGSTIDCVIMRPNTTASIMTFASTEDSKQGEIYYHYTANSRIGI
ncbi:MAG TPA: hypothetical protein VJ279_08425 [Hanamia sp.]|jgi:hypothetical protein|nr:hypothetical protein [Hanamia sp.]